MGAATEWLVLHRNVIDKNPKPESDDRGPRQVTIDRRAPFGFGFGLRGGLPLEQAFSRNELPNHGPDDGVDGEHHLMRQENEIQQGDESSVAEGGKDLAHRLFMSLARLRPKANPSWKKTGRK